MERHDMGRSVLMTLATYDDKACEVNLNAALAVDQQNCEKPPMDAESGEVEACRTRCYRCGGRACKACSWVDFDPQVGRKTRRCRDCRTQDGERWA